MFPCGCVGGERCRGKVIMADDQVQVDVTVSVTFAGYGFLVLLVALFTFVKYVWRKRKEKKDEIKFLKENENDREEARVLQECLFFFSSFFFSHDPLPSSLPFFLP